MRHPGGESLANAWRKLSGIARRLADANKVNGALLEVREQQVRSALVAMAPEPPSVYGRSGMRHNLPSGRVYSRA